MSNGFAGFTEAVSRRSTTVPAATGKALDRVAVLGGGADARLIAAMCLAENATVSLFSAYGAELQQLRGGGGIALRGAGPVGSYQIDREGVPSIQTTAELDHAVTDADVIFLTGPVHKQRTYAMVLADHLSDGQVLVLAPGRSLGALEAAWFLRIGGCRADITIVEAQGLPFFVSANGSQLNLSAVLPVAAATLPSGRTEVLTQLKRYLPNIEPVESVLQSGFADGSALVEIPALLVNGPAVGDGSVNIPMGGQPLPENATFAALIGDEQRAVIAQLAEERLQVAQRFGMRNLPDVDRWISLYAGEPRGEGSRPVPGRAESAELLRDGVIGSLVPLLSAAELTGTPVPMTQTMITLVSSVLGVDVAAAGRRLNTIGISAGDIDSARKAMDKIASGDR
jgi:hypothetical protein